ncbi:unnamed protein product [Orchesella dallaii]|uniref:Peptidase M3A/M3B catalytic domain-containing protein n=1 Tax=Orchesella dallaii TaxID=48710 RepID=A0ABP1QX51_9HEXA
MNTLHQLKLLEHRCSYSFSSLAYRGLTTWSPLATNFNSRPSKKLNFLSKDGLFGMQELRDPTGFHLLKDFAIQESDALVNECVSSSRQRKLVEVFDNLSNSLCKVADMAEFVRVAHPNGNFAHAAEDACLSISRLVEKLNTNRELYLSLKGVVGQNDVFPTTDVDEHVAKLFLFDFEQSGIHLDEKRRSRVVYLNDYILYTGQQFAANAMKPTSISKSQIPSNIQSFFPSDNGQIIVTGLFSDAYSEAAREAAYKIYLHPDKKQDELLVNLLMARHELAEVCGFPTYAHRALQGSLAESPTLVANFLERLAEKLGQRAERDFYHMTKMKGNVVQVWDPPYLTVEAKRTLFNVDRSDFMPYFSLGACMEGLNLLFQQLFGIELVASETQAGEVWTTDVYKIQVSHKTDGVLGEIYCDFYEREGKPHQDCHFTIQGGKELEDGTYQNPIVVLMLNFTPPSGATPSLLTPSMVDNLFHEMGHAVHSMLARTKYQHVTGTRCTTDFAEVPSILMEYFASDPRVLGTFARHYITGEVMPEELRWKYAMSKHVFAASEMQMQNFYAALDQTLHTGKFPLDRPSIQILEDVHSKFYGLPYVHNTAWHLRFGHLVGYGAKYYSYLMSRAVASWIWMEYFQENPFNSASGERYKSEVLAHGGGVPAKQMVSDFLGKAITPDSLTQALIIDLDFNEKRLDEFQDGKRPKF